MKYVHLSFDGCNGWAHCGTVSKLPEEVGGNGQRGVFPTENGDEMYISVEPPDQPEEIWTPPKTKSRKVKKPTREMMKSVLAKHGPLNTLAFWGLCSGKLESRGVFNNLLRNKKKNGGDFVKTSDGKWKLP